MTTATTHLIREGEEELVKLPPEIKYGRDVELTIARSGDVITIRPKLDEAAQVAAQRRMIQELRGLPRPSEVEVRDPDIFPDRPNLYR